MTRDEQLQCIADNVDAFKKVLLAKAWKLHRTGTAWKSDSG